MRSRLLSLFTAAVLLSHPLIGAAAEFSDATATRYREAFVALSQKDIVHGFPDGTARPYAYLNRAEALKILTLMKPQLKTRAEWFSSHMPRIPLFRDVDQSAWYARYVETQFEAGNITGYPDKTFRPASRLTVEEAIVLLHRIHGLSQKGTGTDGWFQKDLERSIQKNLIAAEENIYLGDPITRGQFVDIAYRFDVVQTQGLTAFVDSQGSTGTRPMLVRRPSTVPSAVAGVGTQESGGEFTISIPRLGITSLNVIHPQDAFTSKGLLAPLKYGLGHLFSYPGRDGKIMVYGHSSDYAWNVSDYSKIFARINELRAGDQVFVKYKGSNHTYEVTHQLTIAPHDVSHFMGRGEMLILYTCWPVGSAAKRLIVFAKPVSVEPTTTAMQ